MKNLSIESVEVFNDYSQLVELRNSATSSPGELYLEGFQVDLRIDVCNNLDEIETFNIQLQSTERNNGMMAYSNWGMSISDQDADESLKLDNWLSETDQFDFFEEIIEECLDKALPLAEAEYEKLIAE